MSHLTNILTDKWFLIYSAMLLLQAFVGLTVGDKNSSIVTLCIIGIVIVFLWTNETLGRKEMRKIDRDFIRRLDEITDRALRRPDPNNNDNNQNSVGARTTWRLER